MKRLIDYLRTALSRAQIITESTDTTEIVEVFDAGQAFSEGFAVDRDAALLRNVTILGPVSQNGRRYSERAMADAARLYEGASFYIDHPGESEARDRKGARSVRDLAGKIVNVRRTNPYIRGDIQLLRGNPISEHVMSIAEQMPDKAGNSHRVAGVLSKPDKSGIATVESIDKVFGVELVTDPATTRGLFESRENKTEEVKHMTLEELKAQHPELVSQIIAEQSEQDDVTALRAEVKTLKDVVAERDARIDELETAQKIAEHKALVEDKLAAAKLPEKAITDKFREQLETAENEAEVDALIADRKELVEVAQHKAPHLPEKKQYQPDAKSSELSEADYSRYFREVASS